jgi:threonine/homoserine/homoserine lactone efflux protein
MLSIFSLPELISLMIFTAAMSFSPGPNTMLTTAIATNEGIRKTIPFALAVPVGWLVIMISCGLGIGTVIIEIPSLRLGIKLLGCAYLIWLSYKLCKSKKLLEVNTSKLNVNFSKGVLLQFLNIKVWLLAITITGTWIIDANGQPSTNPNERLALACAVVMFFAFTSNMTFALAGALFRNWLGSGNRLAIFNYFLALVLMLTALWTLSI